ncbi:Metalloenzyme, LuxS/M16 peptidase-like protein [Kockovaella imperatae]|uniref:Metalloenzyme, LuxS/M16 peptidase-like protein n=1 Tax=Kockovaella imperatae TaxID=4999 RepID=A0A1Y1UHW4_9TREE|nr:Metalloenzyme, LuxS/M16 peptidase-like protein [Kockovaella imperatae]ORX37612.1 Metalloenzyme, LuxS/M16 peptidase-like protein [Kockovaella imperatae]
MIPSLRSPSGHSLRHLVHPRPRHLATSSSSLALLITARHLSTRTATTRNSSSSSLSLLPKPRAKSAILSSTLSPNIRRSCATPSTPTSHTTSSSSSPAIPLPPSPIMASRSPFPPCPPIPKAPGPIDLILPPTEDRPHRYFTLSNGLEVIVISDPEADKSAASMDVGVGHLSDPVDLPGCAHFCEHLLFMGTKKYPVENAYQQYLSSHNGHSNAYTAMTSTVYFFDVGADALEGALDRFSGFFKEPLFNEDCTEREIKAVDSEHKKNLQNDIWRLFQLEKHVLRKDHAYHKFGTGDYDSLWSTPKSQGRDPRQQLISWWEKWYCARRMKLAVVGKEDLDTLEKWVKERFEDVPVRSEGLPDVGEEGVRVAFETNPISEEQMGHVVFAKPVQDNRGLEITFPFPEIDHLYQSKPAHYLTHFIGHEGPGSLLSYLKKQGWVNGLRAGTSHAAVGFDFIKIGVDLTPSGLQHWKDVSLAIYKYINLLRSQRPSEEIFNEIKAMAEISFRFAEKAKNGRYATAVSNWMQKPLPRDKILSGGARLEEFREDEIIAAIQCLDPRTSVIGITGRELPADVEGSFNLTEPIYGTEYKMMKLDKAFMKEAMSGAPIPELKLPGKNLFIPERLDVNRFDVKEPALRPTLITDTSVSRLWHKQDDRFWLPKAYVNVLLHSPILNNTPRNHVLARLFIDLFGDSISEDIYDAEMAELSFNVQYSTSFIGIGAGGFSDKLAVLLETMLKKMMDFEVDPKRFDGIVEDLRLAWRNFPLNDPYRQVIHWGSYVHSEDVWTPEERLEELEQVTPDQVKAYAKEVLQRLFIETLVHGNTDKQGAKEIQDMLERVLHPRALAEGEKHSVRSLTYPPASEHIWSIDLSNSAESNSAITYSLYVGDRSDAALRAHLALFAQIASEPTFDRLRTKEQLGYITDSQATANVGSMFYRILVQSERDPVYVETRIEAFLEWLKGHIEEMSEEEFEKQKAALIAKREEKPKNLGEETRRFWAAIGDQFYEFGKRQTDVHHLKNTTKSHVLDMFNRYIHPSSSSRSKLSVHMRSTFKGTVLDPESASPLLEAFTKHSIPIDMNAVQALLASSPSLKDVKAFAESAIQKSVQGGSLGPEAADELGALVSDLREKEGGIKDDGVNVRPNNVFIDNIHRFKAGLIPSRAAYPVEPLKVEEARL